MEVYSSAMGGAIGIASAVLQVAAVAPVAPTPPAISVGAFIIPVVSAVIGGLMSYAVLRNTVNRMEKDVLDINRNMHEINLAFRDVLVKLGHLEGRMDAQKP